MSGESQEALALEIKSYSISLSPVHCIKKFPYQQVQQKCQWYINYLKEGLHPSISPCVSSDQFSEEPEDLPHEPRIFPITALRGMKRIHSGVFSHQTESYIPLLSGHGGRPGFSQPSENGILMCGRHKETSPSLRTPSCHVL